jgi:hypothetical protein
MHTAEPLTPKSISFETEIAIVTQKRYKLPGIDGILTDQFPEGGNTLHSEIHKTY